MTTAILTGTTQTHLVPCDGNIQLHSAVVEPFERLRRAAQDEGIGLIIASGFRSFDRQLAIWNAKACGQRPVLADDGTVLCAEEMDPRELLFAILRWSALPGASRHHWGSDMDVWDERAVDAGYALQLTPDEYAADGPFGRLGAWLNGEQLVRMGFYRPYAEDRGGVAPEPWHLSYRPVATEFARALDVDILAGVIAAVDIALKEQILANLDHIYERFIRVPG